MSKLFLALMISLFAFGACALSFIIVKWNTQRLILSWQLMRQRGYDYLHRSKKEYALEFFSKGKELASGLGASDYRYAESLVDVAGVKILDNELDDARKLLKQANSIFDKSNAPDGLLNNALINERFRSYCMLVNLELKAGKSEKAQKLCTKILEMAKQPNVILEALSRRQIANTLLAAGDFAGRQRSTELAQTFYKEALALTAKLPPFADLERTAQKKLAPDSFASGQSPADLLDKGAAYMKRRQLPIANYYLQKARELALETNDPALMQIDFQLAKLAISQTNYEQAETSFLNLLRNPNFKDQTGLDEVLTKLTFIYRNSGGHTEDAARILRKQIAVRKQEYGADSAKVAAIEIELAQTLESMGQYEEAKKIWQATVQLKEALGDEEDSCRLAGVMLRTGDAEKAKPIFERIVYRFENGSVKLGNSSISACCQLAAIYLMEGKNTDAKKLIDATIPYFSELAPIHRILLSESLIDTAMSMNESPAAASELIRLSIIALPEVVDRRIALRCMKTVSRLEPFKSQYPKVFDAKMTALIKKNTEASSSFKPAKLQGYSG